MKLNNIGLKIWAITIGLTLCALLGTTFFYGYFYRQQVETSYLNDYNEIILNLENLSETNPKLLTSSLNQHNTLNSRIHFSVLRVEKNSRVLPDSKTMQPITFPPYIQKQLRQEEKVVQAVEDGKDVQIQEKSKTKEDRGIPYLFRMKNFELDGNSYVLYSYTDLSFLKTLEVRMIPVFAWLIVIYSFLTFIYYHYLYLLVDKRK